LVLKDIRNEDERTHMSAGQPASAKAPVGTLQTSSFLDERILAMVMAQSPLRTTLDALCLNIEQHHPGTVCSILLLDADGVTLRSGAAPSLPEEYNRAIDGLKIGARVGSCGTAVYRKQPVIVSDIASDPLWTEYRVLALSVGLRACWSTPIIAQNGEVLGTFAIYYRETRVPDAEDLRLIAHASHLVALAIERDRDKSQLKAAEDRYRTLVERLPAITYVAELGSAGPWHYVSPQIESILGFSPEEWLADSLNWLNQIHPDDQGIAIAAEERFQKTRELFQAEYRMLSRDGRTLWFRDEGVMLNAAGNDALVMQGVLYDITEHKRLEEQLRHSQKLEAVGQLAGGVAHDFNNLLMVIQAHNERLREQLSPEHPAQQDTLQIERSVSRASALTQQLLAFSRRQALQLKPIQLNAVITDVAKMLVRLIPASVQLQIEPSAPSDFVKGDAGQIEQVIMNLAVNACDAMERGGRFAIETRNIELREGLAAAHAHIPPGKYVILSVSDTGAGMTRDVQAHIFEPFFTTKQPGKGTGLGLSIVYGVVKQTGGWITVRSALERGTTFDIYFPLLPAKEAPMAPSSKAAVKSAPTLGGNETILLVEDQDGIRDLVREYLGKNGYTVLHAANGSEALKIASAYEGAIQLLLSDVIMPNVGGVELAHRLSRPRPDMKVLFMSGYPDHATSNGETFDESAEVLQKPFLLDTLARKLRILLDS
jgi:PAS domain S-box-containing protein